MAEVVTYLNFMGTTAEAFEHYRSVFGTEYRGDIVRLGDVPSQPGQPEMTEAEKAMVMHVALPITGGHVLMGTDAIESAGHVLNQGNNVSIMVIPDTRDEAEQIFAGLVDGATDVMAMQEMFWGDYFGSLCDRFGIRWMINHHPAED
ncbi:MAG: VOC family protein [Acidimicrobiales bacterium]